MENLFQSMLHQYDGVVTILGCIHPYILGSKVLPLLHQGHQRALDSNDTSDNRKVILLLIRIYMYSDSVLACTSKYKFATLGSMTHWLTL